ncbi:winged helix DNA-binding domain-containing protein [Isoptericola sp. NPDC057391]|uniref:winged helix DNA-binding domain-containing protein n=1 Tax=Isoptericola sp. NPDC057391 TaxID=3346117 RepID=UPI003635DF7E
MAVPTTTGGTVSVLALRELNRATLARQLLLARADRSPLSAVEHLVGLNAQDPDPPYLGLWSRLARFDLQDLTALMTDRSVVRGTFLRGTQYTVTAGDYLWIRPLLQPMLERLQRSAFRRATEGLDLPALLTEAREVIRSGDEVTRPQVGRALAALHPGRDPAALARSAQFLLPVLHPPPDSTWGRRGPTPFVLAEDWLGSALDAHAPVERLVLRYLAAFGPASVRDVTAWSGLTRMREVVDGLRPRLATFRDPSGRELVDLPDAPRPSGDVEAPVRFLAPLDNVLLGHHDRTRIVTDEQRSHVFLEAAVTVDGFVRGLWRIRRRAGTATVVVRLFRSLSAAERDALTAEAVALARFVAPDADAHDVAELEVDAPWPPGAPWDPSGPGAGVRR